MNLARIYINFAFVKIISDIDSETEQQGDYFDLFLVVAMTVCIVSQVPNIYSLIRTFDALLGELLQNSNKSKPLKSKDEII